MRCEFEGQMVELEPDALSPAGVFIVTTAPPAVDREIELYLHSAIGTIAVQGQVVQVIDRARAARERRSPGFGVLFIDLADDQRAFIGLSLDAALRTPADDTGPRDLRRSARAAHPEREEPPELARRRAQTLRELTRELEGLSAKSAWELLGLSPEADAETAHRAYLESTKRYHPHVYAHLDSPEINRLATELFIAHKRAYSTLSLRPAAPAPAGSHPPRELRIPSAPRPPAVSLRAAPSGTPSRAPARAATAVRSLARTPAATRPGTRQPKSDLADAQAAFNTGLKHLAAGRYDDAASELERASQLCPSRRDVLVWLHLCRARKLKADGNPEAALDEYQKLLAFEPDHREALEHLEGARGRRRNFIHKLFGTRDE